MVAERAVLAVARVLRSSVERNYAVRLGRGLELAFEEMVHRRARRQAASEIAVMVTVWLCISPRL